MIKSFRINLMKLDLNKGVILGIVGGICVFLVSFLIIMNFNSDFDEQLIIQVDNGVTANKLTPQIYKQDKDMKLNAQKRLESNVLNKPSTEDYNKYDEEYNSEIKMISNYTQARIKFANGETTKDEFLDEIKTPKEYLEIMDH